MSTIALSLPVSGTVVTAGLHSTNYTTIQNVINGGLDTANWGAGKIFAPSKFMQEAAADGDGLAWDNTALIWKPTTGKQLRLGALSGVPAAAITVPVIYGRQTTSQDVANTVTETTLLGTPSVGTWTVAANDLGTARMLRLKLIGDFLKNNIAGDTLTLKVKFGGTIHYAGSVLSAQVGANRHPWHLDLSIANLGATNSQMVEGTFGPVEFANSAAPTTGIGNPVAGGAVGQGEIGIAAPAAIDTTLAQTVDVTATWSAASANNSFRLRYAVMELV